MLPDLFAPKTLRQKQSDSTSTLPNAQQTYRHILQRKIEKKLSISPVNTVKTEETVKKYSDAKTAQLPTPEATQLFEQGLHYLRNSQLRTALSTWEQALKLAPTHRPYQVNVERLRKKLDLSGELSTP